MLITGVSDFWIHLGLIGMGLIIGSFLNVVIHRMPEDRSLFRPRSFCPQCGGTIRWYDNIPILSFLWLKGRCRFCRHRIELRYPVVEFLIALLFLTTYLKFGLSFSLFLRDWPFVSLLVAIAFIDLKHHIIPDELSWGGLIWGGITLGLDPVLSWQEGALGAAFGFGFFYLFAFLYYKLSGRVGLGGGDIKLLGMIGVFLGFQGVLATILFSSILGSVLGLVWAWSSQKDSVLRVAIPYGPFLVVGAFLYYFLGEVLWHPFMIAT